MSTGDPYFLNDINSQDYTISTISNTTSTVYPYSGSSAAGGTTWIPTPATYMGIPIIVDPALEVDVSIKFGGKHTNKIDWDLSRFTLINRIKFIYNLLFKGKAIMEVEPKLIKLEKALEVLKNAK